MLDASSSRGRADRRRAAPRHGPRVHLDGPAARSGCSGPVPAGQGHRVRVAAGGADEEVRADAGGEVGPGGQAWVAPREGGVGRCGGVGGLRLRWIGIRELQWDLRSLLPFRFDHVLNSCDHLLPLRNQICPPERDCI